MVASICQSTAANDRFYYHFSLFSPFFFFSFAGSESALLALDLGGFGDDEPDGNMDVLLGYPSQQAADSDLFPCGNVSFDISCFGLYLYSSVGFTSPQ